MSAAASFALANRRLAASALGRSLLGGGLPTGAPPLLAAGAPGDSQGVGSMRENGGRPGGREARPRRAKSARLAAQVAACYTPTMLATHQASLIAHVVRLQRGPKGLNVTSCGAKSFAHAL